LHPGACALLTIGGDCTYNRLRRTRAK